MKKQNLIIVILSLLLFSCNSSSDKNENILKNDTNTLNTKDFSKIFHGSINDKYNIDMSLIKIGNELKGNYKYEGQEDSIIVSGTIDDENKFIIYELNKKGEKRGFFNGKLEDETMVGFWNSADSKKNFPFKITSFQSDINITTINQANCEGKEITNNEGELIILKTCFYKNFKSVSHGYPDYKGRYSYDYELFKKKNGKYIKINNQALFNENSYELLNRINFELEKTFNKFASSSESSDCFNDISFSKVSFNQLGIEFDNDKINFNVTFGLPSACLAVDGTIISYKLDDVKKYFVE